MAISNKSNRFDGEKNDNGSGNDINNQMKDFGSKAQKQTITVNSSAEITIGNKSTAVAFTTSPNGTTETIEVAISNGGQFQLSALPKSFKGERGGVAKNADLCWEYETLGRSEWMVTSDVGFTVHLEEALILKG